MLRFSLPACIDVCARSGVRTRAVNRRLSYTQNTTRSLTRCTAHFAQILSMARARFGVSIWYAKHTYLCVVHFARTLHTHICMLSYLSSALLPFCEFLPALPAKRHCTGVPSVGACALLQSPILALSCARVGTTFSGKCLRDS